MYIFITILAIVAAILVGAIVLIQNPKGGGLSGSFGGVGQQLLGARRSTDVIEKLTWGFAAALLFFCLTSAFFVDRSAVNKADALPKSEIEQQQMKNGFNTAPAQGQGMGSTPQPAQQPAEAPAN